MLVFLALQSFVHNQSPSKDLSTELCAQHSKMTKKSLKATLKPRSKVTTTREKRYPSRGAVKTSNESCTSVRHAVKHFSTEDLDKMPRLARRRRRNRKDGRRKNDGRSNEVPLNSIKRRLRTPVYEYVVTSKPLLSTRIRKKRLEWAKTHESWTIQDWSRVLWTGRSKFDTFAMKRSVFVWGCFSRAGVGDLVLTGEEISQDQYEIIMEKHGIPSGLRLAGDTFIMQQESSSKLYFAVYTSPFMPAQEETEIVFQNMEWPDQSSDISPMRFLWDELERTVRQHYPFTKKHLWQILEDTWNALKPKQLEKFVASMPRICQAVIKNKGGSIDEKIA